MRHLICESSINFEKGVPEIKITRYSYKIKEIFFEQSMYNSTAICGATMTCTPWCFNIFKCHILERDNRLPIDICICTDEELI